MKWIKKIFFNKTQEYNWLEIFCHWSLVLMPIGIIVCLQIGTTQWNNVNLLIDTASTPVIANIVFLSSFLVIWIFSIFYKMLKSIRKQKKDKGNDKYSNSDYWS